MEAFLILIGVIAVGWFLIAPILLIVLWVRLRHLEERVQVLARRKVAEPAPAPRAEPQHAPAAELPRPEPTAPAPTPAPIWIEEAAASPVAPAPRETASERAPKPAKKIMEGLSLEELLAGKWMTWVG